MSNAILKDVDFDEAAFVPSAYNNTYYQEVMEDEQCLIEWQAGVLHDLITDHLRERGEQTYSHHFDAGSGPSVHHLLALHKYSDAIHIADYIEGNLDEIRKWADKHPDAHDWRPFVHSILVAEGAEITVNESKITEREDAVRSKIASYNPLDLKNPTSAMSHYSAPLVTSFFVADSATGDKKIFTEMTKNAFNIVETGGLFIAAYLGGCTGYSVGDKCIKSANLTQSDIEEAMKACGAKDVRIWRFDTPSLSDEGFDHIFAVTAKS